VGSINRRVVVQDSWDIKQDPISKIPKAKRARGMAQVVECLNSKNKALSSNLIVATKQERKEKKNYTPVPPKTKRKEKLPDMVGSRDRQTV
jgi:hypothetical protein